jgi:dUTP pyrophosphatase
MDQATKDLISSIIQIKKFHNEAILPTRGSEFAAGYDLYSVESIVIPSKGQAIVDTGIGIAMPHPGMYARVAPRSGLAAKFGLDVGAGVVDFDYQASIKVILFNHASEKYQVCRGDRIAQLIFERIYHPQFMQIVDDLPGTTARGQGGFGSTGI